MLQSIIKISRPSQWIKNLIIFAAIIFAGEAASFESLTPVILAFVSFCLISSAMYIINDITDKKNDQNHPVKKNRPLASGALKVSTALIFAVIFAIASIAISFTINNDTLIILICFFLFNILYSVALKKIVILDVMAIALSFVLRAYAGAMAASVPASKWLFLNTLLLALFLGFGKRRHELLLLETNASSHRKILDKYSPYLLDQLIGVVTPAVVVIYIMYTFSAEVSTKLGTENLYYTIPFVIYGIFRYLYLIHKEEKGGSPTNVLITDIPILVTVILWILTVILILYQL